MEFLGQSILQINNKEMIQEQNLYTYHIIITQILNKNTAFIDFICYKARKELMQQAFEYIQNREIYLIMRDKIGIIL